MSEPQRNGLAPGALQFDREAVVALHELCNAAGGLDIPLFLDLIPETVAAEGSAGYYADGDLVGFALLPVNPGPEATIFVHPEYRRRGIGTTLLAAMREVARTRGLASFITVTDAASTTAAPFMTASGATYGESEYRLLLDPDRIDRSPKLFPDLVLRPANEDDVDTILEVLATAFERDDPQAHDRVLQSIANPKRQFHLGVLNGEPIGVLRTSIWDDDADVTGFGVLPKHRGRGYGRQMLRDAIDLLLAAGQERITIEVATDNANALGLYQSCGFEVIAKFDYYDLSA